MIPKLRRFLNADTSARTPETRSYWLFFAHLMTIWGLALSNAFLALTALSTLWTKPRPTWSWRRVAPLLVPLGLYVLFFTTSTITSIDPRISLPELRQILSLLPMVLALLLVRGEVAVRRVFDGLIFLVALLAVHGIAQNYFGGYGTLHRRIVGLFSHYQTYAGILLVGNLLLLGRLLMGIRNPTSKDKPGADIRHHPWHWLALLAINWALLLTLTRGAWVAAILTLTLYLIVRTRKFFSIYLVVGLLIAGLFFFVAPDSWTERARSIVDLQDISNYDRFCMADASFYMISERPLLGIGPKMVRSRYPIYRHPTAPRFTVPHLHNSFLQLAAEQGLVSLAAYFWLMGSGLLMAYRGYRREGGSRGARADLYLGTILVIIGFNLAGLFEDNWRDSEVQRLVLFCLAAPCCLAARPNFTTQDGSGTDNLPETDRRSTPSDGEPR